MIGIRQSIHRQDPSHTRACFAQTAAIGAMTKVVFMTSCVVWAMVLSAWSVASFLLIFVGYITASTVLQVTFYYSRRTSIRRWKVQPTRRGGVGDARWWLPILRLRLQLSKPRARQHWIFATVNLTIASCFAGATAECVSRGGSRLYRRDWLQGNGLPPFHVKTLYDGIGPPMTEALLLVAALALQSVLEYWWHIGMHMPYFYTKMHKHHHHYKSPEPFDDMMIHPLEAFGYYCILYSPAYVVPMHVFTFAVYMSILGTFGILDHSGVKFAIPGLYDTRDHDAHHSRFECNYAFPFPYLDIMHGTYTGTFAGKVYVARKPQGRMRQTSAIPQADKDTVENVQASGACLGASGS